VINICPACGSKGLIPFFTLTDVPVQSVPLITRRTAARRFPRGDITLSSCPVCGFITNSAFEADRLDYGDDYESTQACSPTFNSFHRDLAESMLRRCRLRNRHVIEIGCGQGEFLSLLCRMGECRGTGFDPAFRAERSALQPGDRVTMHAEKFPSGLRLPPSDLICCKMTLEHIQPVAEFVRGIAGSIGGPHPPKVFFQVPDADRILRERAFWDVYYEHCSYFTAGALSRLFRAVGFRVRSIERGYSGQYLFLEADPSSRARLESVSPPSRVAVRRARDFSAGAERLMMRWRESLKAGSGGSRPTMLWGAGSKAVSFLTSLDIGEEILGAIDINPRKRDTFLPGTGHPVMVPDDLDRISPGRIIVLNPIYMPEIRRELRSRGLHPELIEVGRPPRPDGAKGAP